MNEPTLVILAAGMGSRYGGLKQIDPIGKNGEIIIDYSIYDAIRAGFRRIVLLIRESMHGDIERMIGKNVARHAELRYAFQEPGMFLPQGYSAPEGRKKPWGTGHALLCCRDVVDGNFVMINADDYYGPHAYEQMHAWLKSAGDKGGVMDYSMVAYILKNTLTDHGKVARGVCVTEGGRLANIIERTHIVKTPEGPAFSEDGGATLTPLSEETMVSMNFLGFTPSIFDVLAEGFPAFLEKDVAVKPETAEYLIPSIVGGLIREGRATVEVMQSTDKWHGVTYKEDKAAVQQAIAGLVASGLYPEKLWE